MIDDVGAARRWGTELSVAVASGGQSVTTVCGPPPKRLRCLEHGSSTLKNTFSVCRHFHRHPWCSPMLLVSVSQRMYRRDFEARNTIYAQVRICSLCHPDTSILTQLVCSEDECELSQYKSRQGSCTPPSPPHSCPMTLLTSWIRCARMLLLCCIRPTIAKSAIPR